VIFVVGVENQIIYQSPSVTRVLGYQPGELAGRTFDRLLHQGDLARSVATLDRMRQPGVGGNKKADWRLLCADGGLIDAEVVCSNLVDDPDVQGLVLTIRDATQRRVCQHGCSRPSVHVRIRPARHAVSARDTTRSAPRYATEVHSRASIPPVMTSRSPLTA
jgi:PAS domain S-box-containing protein